MKHRWMGIVWPVCLVLLLGACTPTLTEQDKTTWIYYVDDFDCDVHQCRPDGTEDSVTDMPRYMQQSGNWIFYSGGKDLYRLDADGSDKTRLTETECINPMVIGDQVVFLDSMSDLSDGEGNMRMYRIGMDGKGLAQICKDSVTWFGVCGEWLIYGSQSEDSGLYRIRPDGTGQERISWQTGWFQTVGDWIYCGGINLQRLHPDGSEPTIICKDSIQGFSIAEDWIYYINGSDNDNVYKVKTDGTGRKRLAKGPAGWITALGDWVFFSVEETGWMGGTFYPTYRIRTNGTGLAATKSENRYFDPAIPGFVR